VFALPTARLLDQLPGYKPHKTKINFLLFRKTSGVDRATAVAFLQHSLPLTGL
jgi:hypothetical protein